MSRLPDIDKKPAIFRPLLMTLLITVFYASPQLSAKIDLKKDSLRNMSLHMLRIAKDAYESGDYAEARRIWMQVRSISPALPEPEWLQNQPRISRDVPTEPKWTRQRLLVQIDKEGFTAETVAALQEWLKKNPEDRLIRSLLLSFSAIKEDQTEMNRHRSVLQKDKAKESFEFSLALLIKILVLIGVIYAVICQIKQLHKDFFVSKDIGR